MSAHSCGETLEATNVRFHLGAVALLIVALIGDWGCGRSQSANNQSSPPTPTITTLSPNGVVAGGAAFTLTINGTNFVASSVVNFGGAVSATTFVNSTQLTAAIPASSIASTGTPAVTVTNPASAGGTSNAVDFTVSGGSNSVPTINALGPSCVPAGEQFVDSVDNQLTVVVQNFVANSVVRWNGSDRPTAGNGSINGLVAQISASDIATAGTAAVTVFNPGPGGGSSNPFTFTITPGGVDPQSIAVNPAGTFAYVANAGCVGGAAGYVSMYTIDPTTGVLASIGPPVSSQDATAGWVTVNPSGKFAYVTNTGDWFTSDGSVATYTINATTGALTFVGAISGNCPGLCMPLSAAVDPSGKFAYVPNGDGVLPTNVAMYTINATTGVLASIGTIPVEGFANSVAVDPSDKFVYVAAASETFGSAGNVSVYTINATTGALASNGTIAAGTEPVSVVVDPSGKFAYVVNFNSSDVSMYTIDGSTGALASIGTIAAGPAPTSIAVHPSGKFAYVTNSATNDVSIYTIDAATGALTLIGTIGT